jgi:hypothetical protein
MIGYIIERSAVAIIYKKNQEKRQRIERMTTVLSQALVPVVPVSHVGPAKGHFESRLQSSPQL